MLRERAEAPYRRRLLHRIAIMADPLRPEPQTSPRWASYIAIGDSFSEGMCDPYSAEHGGDGTDDGPQRGWADRLADELAARRTAGGAGGFEYANLAIRGKKIGQIMDEQLQAAIEQKPDLVSVVGGGNDLLRPGGDVEVLLTTIDDGVAALREAGCDVLMGTGFKAGGALAWTQKRTGVFNAGLWTIARARGAYMLDLWGMRSLWDWRMWAADRMHMIDDGHRRVMNAALYALGLDLVDDEYDVPLIPAPEPPLAEKVKTEAQWSREHVAPWIKRRLTHTSSGDGREPKWPTLIDWPRPLPAETPVSVDATPDEVHKTPE
jgi:lysophospholipase L1-like esterase